MEDFKFIVSVRFPELEKCLPRLNFGSIMETYGKKGDKFLVLNIFEIMLRNTIEYDGLEEIPLSAFTEMYFYIIENYFRLKEGEDDLMFLGPTFKLLFQTLVRLKKITPEYCVKFFTNCKGASNWNISFFFYFLSLSDIKLILDCFAKQRFNAWDIKNGNSITDYLRHKQKYSSFCDTLFIRYGFKYCFDFSYCRDLCEKLLRTMWVNDKPLYLFMDLEKLVKSEDIRIQLAVELLVVLFIDDNNKNAISLLWKALPYNFITSTQMFRLLMPYAINRFYYDVSDLVDLYGAKVHTVLPVPDVFRKSETRSLKHLSRVQVRNNLNEVHNLNEETIRELYIPETLKGYLWLDDF